jgi:SAM-dependent methyltransferase
MDKNHREKIIAEIAEFYKNHAEEFSKTRRNPWQGWQTVLTTIKEQFVEKDELSILDLGCGNGRFYAYLKENLGKDLQYTGIDNNDFMMIEAIMKYPQARFISLDVLQEIEKVEGRYDLVAAFGLTHHLPGQEFRLNWFKNVLDKVAPDGLVVFTFWNLQTDKRFEKAEKADGLEENDYYYGWGDSEDKRYVHIYDESEIKRLAGIFTDKGFKLLKTYDADGKNGKMNTYLILQSA